MGARLGASAASGAVDSGIPSVFLRSDARLITESDVRKIARELCEQHLQK